MTKQLIVRLDEQEQIGAWIILDEANQIIHDSLHAKLADLSTIATDCTLTVLVPSQSILLTEVGQLPKTTYAKIRKAVPFLLEDQLYQDIDELHFALGDPTATGSLPVAVVAHQQLKRWMQIIQRSLPIFFESLKAIVPDLFSIPLAENSWSIFLTPELASVHTGAQKGFVLDSSNALSVLANSLKGISEEKKPSSLYVYSSEPSVSTEQWPSAFAGVPVIAKPFTEEQKISFVKNLSEQKSINLLQGSYRMNKKLSKVQTNLQLAGLLAGCALLISLAGSAMQYLDLYLQEKKLSTRIDELYRSVFPNANSIIEPKYRFEQELATLIRTQQRLGFLKMMDKASPIFTQAKDIKLQSLQYQNQQLTVDVTAPDLTSVNQLIKTFNQHGLKVTQNNISSDMQTVRAHLVIKGSAS